ncbi:unnamed protein product [Musa hybrid cultivar]
MYENSGLKIHDQVCISGLCDTFPKEFQCWDSTLLFSVFTVFLSNCKLSRPFCMRCYES